MRQADCPDYPRFDTQREQTDISALGSVSEIADGSDRFRFAPKSGRQRDHRHVRFVPNFGLMHCSKSLKQLIGTGSSDGGEVGLP